MKRGIRYVGRAVMASACVVWGTEAEGAGLSQAKVTQVEREVWLVPPGQEPRSAGVGSVVSGTTAVRTGVKSLAEVTFADQTLLRLGSSTQFSFQEGVRDVNLRSGTALFQVPKGSGGLRVRTGSVTAAITGSEAKVKAPVPGEPGSFLLLNLHGTMEVEIDDASFADGDVPKPLPAPRGLAKLFSGRGPKFTVKLGPGEGFYAWVDARGLMVGSSARKFLFDLKENIGSGLLTGKGGVTPGTEEAAARQAELKRKQQLIALTLGTPVPGSMQRLGAEVNPLRSVGRDQAQADRVLAAQQAALAAQQAALAAANSPQPRKRSFGVPNQSTPPVVVPPVVVPPVVVSVPPPVVTPPPPTNTGTPAFDPSKLPFCVGQGGDPNELPYPEHGARSTCRTTSVTGPGGGPGDF